MKRIKTNKTKKRPANRDSVHKVFIQKYYIRTDDFGYPIAIAQAGKDIIHLNATERTGKNILFIIGILNRYIYPCTHCREKCNIAAPIDINCEKLKNLQIV